MIVWNVGPLTKLVLVGSENRLWSLLWHPANLFPLLFWKTSSCRFGSCLRSPANWLLVAFQYLFVSLVFDFAQLFGFCIFACPVWIWLTSCARMPDLPVKTLFFLNFSRWVCPCVSVSLIRNTDQVMSTDIEVREPVRTQENKATETTPTQGQQHWTLTVFLCVVNDNDGIFVCRHEACFHPAIRLYYLLFCRQTFCLSNMRACAHFFTTQKTSSTCTDAVVSSVNIVNNAVVRMYLSHCVEKSIKYIWCFVK